MELEQREIVFCTLASLSPYALYKSLEGTLIFRVGTWQITCFRKFLRGEGK